MRLRGYLQILIAFLFSTTFFLGQAQEKTEKGTIKMDLTYHQQNDALPLLKAIAKTKKGKKFEPVQGVEINLFFNEETAAGLIGRVKSDNKGIASLSLPEKFKSSFNTSGSFIFIATVTGNEKFEDQSTEIEITKTRIELTLDEQDSVRTIHAKLLALQDSSWVEVPEAEIKLVVKRMLSDLSITEDEVYTTDEKGEVSSEFDLHIPGDANGDVIIGAKIDDHELYGSVETTKVVKWGIPLVKDNSFSERTLWATRDKTPLWLLIFPNMIIVSVWGIIFYLIYLIVRIVKLGKANNEI